MEKKIWTTAERRFQAPGFNLEQRVGSHGWLDAQDLHRGPLERGMSLRDWFAGMALQGIIAFHEGDYPEAPQAAQWAYFYADAMLAERNKQSNPTPSAIAEPQI